MASKKKAVKTEPAKVADNEKETEAPLLESPVSTTGAMNVYRADMGESLPPQKPAGVE